MSTDMVPFVDTHDWPTAWLYESQPRYDGVHVHVYFPNGRSASVINHKYSYGIELAVLDDRGIIDYSTPITDDVLGYLTKDELHAALHAIAALPPIAREVTS